MPARVLRKKRTKVQSDDSIQQERRICSCDDCTGKNLSQQTKNALKEKLKKWMLRTFPFLHKFHHIPQHPDMHLFGECTECGLEVILPYNGEEGEYVAINKGRMEQ